MNRIALAVLPAAVPAAVAVVAILAAPAAALVGRPTIDLSEFPWQAGIWIDEWAFLLGF